MSPDRKVLKYGVRLGDTTIQTPYGLAPLNSGLFGDDGEADRNCLQFYNDFCTPQLGLLTIGGVAVSEQAKANPSALALDRQARAAGLTRVFEAARASGVKTAVQLEHVGRQVGRSSRRPTPVAPSAIPCPVRRVVPRELTVREIRAIVSQFGRSASFAMRAGADVVEVHAAHGYLVSGFLSRYSNTRSDTYGGSARNRFRVLEEIVGEIILRTGRRPGVRLNVYERARDGQRVEDVLDGISPMQDSISYLSLTAGQYTEEADLIMPRRRLGNALWRHEAARIRAQLKLPILLAGNIEDVATGNEVIARGEADVVLFGRALLADPKLLQKSDSGADGNRCIDCGLCKYQTHQLPHIYCPVNPHLKAILRPRRSRVHNEGA